MRVLGRTFSTPADCLHLCLGRHALNVHTLSAEVRDEAFWDPAWAYTQPCTCMWTSRFSVMCHSFTKPPVDIARPRISFSVFCSASC